MNARHNMDFLFPGEVLNLAQIKEKATQFFRARLWNRDDLIEQLLDNYEKFDVTIRTELPLNRRH